jgi:hypothetical protein
MEDYREDLFPEIDKNVGRRKKKKRLKLITEKNIRINEEKICATVILFIFLMVASYIAGYSKGTRAGDLKEVSSVVLDAIRIEEPHQTAKSSTAAAVSKDEIKTAEREDGQKPEIKSFALQVVTYNNLEYAQSERDKLKKRGFPAYILRRGKYRVVFVGDYKKQSEANKVLEQLRKTYKDAFIKELKGGS